MLSAHEYFNINGVLSKGLDFFEFRPQQLEMAVSVEETIEAERTLIVEAGPGVGKSLAYLVPFITWAVSKGRKVVISTYTKALQNQLFVKDLPMLKRVLDVEFSYALCMGSENYLCLKRAGIFTKQDLFEKEGYSSQTERVMEWIESTETGLVTDMDFIPDIRVWEKFRRESDLCSARRCRYFESCFFMSAKREQAASHLLVANHALLFTALKGSSGSLPDFHALVIDEAHTLEDVATGHFGLEFSSFAATRFISKLEDLVRAGRIVYAKAGKSDVNLSGLDENIQNLHEAVREFFKTAVIKLPPGEVSSEFDPSLIMCDEIIGSLKEVESTLSDICFENDEGEISELAGAYAERAVNMRSSVSAIFNEQPAGYVYWSRVRETKTGMFVSFNASPVEVSSHIKQTLFDRISTVALTSATLSASTRKGDFTFIKERLGIEDPLEVSVDSPYNYEKNVLLYMPLDVCDPASGKNSYKEDLVRHITQIYDVMGGRIFTLFTSYEMLWAVSRSISDSRPDIDLLKQGDMPRYVLLDVFKKNLTCMLMGTSTFWQGVDVPGSSLECVIVTRLPFGVPTDPVNSARIRAIKRAGRNPFEEYQIPQALIMFKQGFGRLIRGHGDRGVFVVLDPRVHTRGYGSKFLKYLPSCRVSRSIEDVRNFFSEKPDVT